MASTVGNAKTQLHAIRSSQLLFPPHDGQAPSSIVCSLLGTGEGRYGGHVDDLVLEEDHHAAFVEP